MIEVDVAEVYHLFNVMKKYGTKCSLELNTGKSTDPFIGIAQAQVDVEYLEQSGGPDSLIVKLGETDFSFELGSHSFSKHVSSCQIFICVVCDDYTAWFDSECMTTQGIKEAKEYDPLSEEDELVYALGPSDQVSDLLVYFEGIILQLQEGWKCSDYRWDNKSLIVTLQNPKIIDPETQPA